MPKAPEKILKWSTPEIWAERALREPLALLSDHAYLERKAASNALELLNRWPEPRRIPRWESIIASIARDEAIHLEQVLRHLEKRGGRLARLHKSLYANALRGLVRLGAGPDELVDRLLVSALIEARSHERFVLLANAARRCDKELARFYQALARSEAGHYAVYLNLAKKIRGSLLAGRRWIELLREEARIIQSQDIGPGLHSGVAHD